MEGSSRTWAAFTLSVWWRLELFCATHRAQLIIRLNVEIRVGWQGGRSKKHCAHLAWLKAFEMSDGRMWVQEWNLICKELVTLEAWLLAPRHHAGTEWAVCLPGSCCSREKLRKTVSCQAKPALCCFWRALLTSREQSVSNLSKCVWGSWYILTRGLGNSVCNCKVF